jgi:hypothetical protein
MTGSTQRLLEETLGGNGITPGGQQEIDGRAARVDGPEVHLPFTRT